MKSSISSTLPLSVGPDSVGLFRSPVSWAAIFAGLAAALAAQVIFMMLGAGLGFAMYSPLTDDEPIANLGKGAVVVQGVSAVLSLWFGGWVAGRFSPVGARRTGWLHGVLVWCSATVAGVTIVSAGAGSLVSGASKVVGGGLSMAGKPAAAAVSGAADMAKGEAGGASGTLSSFVDEALGTRPEGSKVNTTVRAKREIGAAVARLYNPLNENKTTENRAAVIKALTDNTGMSASEAERTVTDWTASYDKVKADLATAKDDAEMKAREAAEKAADALAIASLCAFLAFVIGAIAAGSGGANGAKVATRHEGAIESI